MITLYKCCEINGGTSEKRRDVKLNSPESFFRKKQMITTVGIKLPDVL